MSPVDTRQPDSSKEHAALRRLTVLWLGGTSLAILLVTLAYLLAQQVGGPLVVTGVGDVTWGDVIGFTILGGTIGAVLAHVSRRFAREPRFTFLAAASIGIAGFAVVPFAAAESLETALWLNTFQLLVAVPVIGALQRFLPPDQTDVSA